MAIVLAYFDGAAEPNPGLGSWGFVVRDLPGGGLACGCGVVPGGPASNNVAEYTALGKLARWLADNGAALGLTKADEVVISGDSKLVVEQVAGRWACRADNLKPLLRRCRELLAALPCRWSVVWVPREQNTLADTLSAAAWVGHTGRPFPAREQPAK